MCEYGVKLIGVAGTTGGIYNSKGIFNFINYPKKELILMICKNIN